MSGSYFYEWLFGAFEKRAPGRLDQSESSSWLAPYAVVIDSNSK